MMLDGELQAARDASGALDAIDDYDLARDAASGSLAQLEGMHLLAPDNPNGLFLLAKAWAGIGYAFIEDDMEAAEDRGDVTLAEHQRKRARGAYDHAVSYALRLLAQRAPGFDQAKKSAATLDRWLADHFTSKDDALNLFWTAYPWLERIDVTKSDEQEGPPLIAELYVGVAMLERAVALDPTVEGYEGMLALGAYHARTGFAEMQQAKTMLDTVVARTDGKPLLVPLTYATKYACVRGDRALYKHLLDQVLTAEDPDPRHGLQNAIAKRRAVRWLGRRRARNECGFDPSETPTPEPAAVGQ
jgi:TRAP transporter T-component